MASEQPLKIIFAGTPEFAAVTLRELLKTSHEIIAVYTQPDRPKGRGRKLTASAVKDVAMHHMLQVSQPETLRDIAEQKKIEDLQADIMVVAAYGLLLPSEVLNAPRLGCVNIHPSLLPRWRGAAPIQRSVLAGDTMTGICIMQMEEGLDTGPVLYRDELPILPQDTAASLHDKLAILGANALIQTLNILRSNHIHPETQDPAKATYADKITKEEGRIDWYDTAVDLDRKIRAFNPWPTAFSTKNGQVFKVWQADLLPATSAQPSGTILDFSAEGIIVATGSGCLSLQKLQFAGGKIVTAKDIFNRSSSRFPSFTPGEKLDDEGPAS